ncbi:unnamed protein product [Caenorhabditis bovis]|uniref:Amino acid permease n=1 Tax=Caenorhabditis bovis TaxID=2654633 RepID=A0A8S1EXD2_9PELO|nr:unnamed protein product [Caenorhabditis bovis]
MIEQNNKIGLITAISYTIGDIVGSGIFISPTSILNHAGSVGLSLCLWAICAVISLFGALSYVELGPSIRKSGCDFAYLTFFGLRPFAASFMWASTCLSYPATMAIQAVTFGEYVITGLDNWIYLADNFRFLAYRLVGFSVLWPLMYLNFFSLRHVAGYFQIVATFTKLIIASIIIFTGFYFIIFKHSVSNFNNSFNGSNWNPSGLVLGIYSGLFAYNGWDVLNFGAEEIENPRRTMPIAAMTGICISATIFLLMNISYFSVLTVDEFKTSPAIAVTFAEKTLGQFHYIVPFLVSLLLLGNLNTTIFACSRYMQAGAKENVMPTPLKLINHSSRSPRLTVFVVVIIAILLSFIGSLDQLISYMSFATWSQRRLLQAAFVYFKFTGKMKSQDSFVVPIIVPSIFFVICVSLLVIPTIQNYHIAVYGLSLTLGGAIIYFIFVRPKHLPPIFNVINDRVVKFSQIMFDMVIDEQSGFETPEYICNCDYKIKL